MESSEECSSLFNLVCALSEAMDLVSPLLVDHHMRTAWFGVNLAREMGLSGERVRKVLFAALLHDLGAFSLRERMDSLQFEFENPHHHACLGFSLLKDFGAFREESFIILAHHTWWKPERGEDVGGDRVPLESHLIHLADRLAILLDGDHGIMEQAEAVTAFVMRLENTMFMPDAVRALASLRGEEGFWNGAFSPDLKDKLRITAGSGCHRLESPDLELLVRLFATIIDYRSSFTATHSAGVAAIAEFLARELGFSEKNCGIMRLAGYLHDLGKLAIPTQILEKPGRLDEEEYHQVQDHVVYTKNLLEKVPELGQGIHWAAQHHERLNGKGYPEHSKGEEISLGSRVISMADMFAAITEDRPYRKGEGRDQTLRVLGRLTREGYLDRDVFKAVEGHFHELDLVRRKAQTDSREDYRLRVECYSESGVGAWPVH